MPHGGAYICYSELCDVKPTSDEVHGLLSRLHPLHTVLLLTRLNTQFRHSSQHSGGDSTSLQRWFGGAFLNDGLLERLNSRFADVNIASRPLCHPEQLLHAIRLALLFAEGDEEHRPDLHSSSRFALGTALLIINDLLVSAEEERKLRIGSETECKTELMVQLAAPVELLNPSPIRNLRFRSHALYRIVLQDDTVRKRLAAECGGLDFIASFENAAHISLAKWLSLAFATYAQVMAQSPEQLLENPATQIIDRTTFIKESRVSQLEMDRFLNTLTTTMEELRTAFESDRRVDRRFDIVPFRSKPFYETTSGCYTCVDIGMLQEKLHTGPFWVINDSLDRQQRWDLFKAWGLIFEAYVNWLMAGIDGECGARFFPDVRWESGQQAFDGMFVKARVLVLMEYKGGMLSQQARYSANRSLFLSDLETKIGEGCSQLARGIAALFPESGPSKRLSSINLPSNIDRVVPVLIFQDSIVDGPFANWWLNNRFQDARKCFPSSRRVPVLPLNATGIDELESMVESTEAGHFDFIHSLNRRCIVDPEMQGNLRDFLIEQPGFGSRGASRFNEMERKAKAALTENIFGFSSGS